MIYRPRRPATTLVWTTFAVALALVIALLVFAYMTLQIKPSPILLGAILPSVVIALLNRVRPLGLDRTGLHIGSADQGYVVPWSTITQVVTVPGNLFQPERIRIRIADSNRAPSWWARLKWGMRARPGAELEVPLAYGQSGAEIADEIRRFIDAYA